MPCEQHPKPLRREFLRAVADEPGIAEQEVERGARDRTLSRAGLEAICLLPAALVSNRPLVLGEVLEGEVATEAVAVGLAGEQVMNVAAHRLVSLKPRLRDNVLAVEGKRSLDRLGLGPDLSGSERDGADIELDHALGSGALDPRVVLDQLLCGSKVLPE